MSEFKKYDSGKLIYSIFPDSVLRDVIKIMMFGAQKYGMHNWKLCEDHNRYYDALRRHLDSWRDGEYYDTESKEPHLAHALCNLVFLHYLEQTKRKDVTNAQFESNQTAAPNRIAGCVDAYSRAARIPSDVFNSDYPGKCTPISYIN